MASKEEQWIEQQKLLENRRIELENFKAKLVEQQEKISNQQREVYEQKNRLDQRARDIEAERQQFEASRAVIPDETSTSTTAQVSNVSFFSTIGALSEFRVGEDWDIYEERLNQYFIANNVPMSRWVAVLITLVGQDAYKILKDLCDPDLPSTKTYAELCEILKRQFAPRVTVFKERREYYNMTQNESESVNDWFARLKSKAVNCKFGAQLDDKLKDGFVSGLKSGPVLDKVFEQSSTATLQAILEVARSKEASLAISSRSSTSELHKIQSKYPKGRQRRGTSFTKKSSETTSKQHPGEKTSSFKAKEARPESTCNHCGGVQHDFKNCKYKEYRCKNCKKVGHLAKICRQSDHNWLNVESDEDEPLELLDMLNLSCGDENDLEFVDLVIEGENITFEIDTGAGRSVIPEKIYKKFLSHCYIEKTSVRLRLYDGTVLVPLGQIDVEIGCNGVKKRGKLVVMKDGCRPLLGKDLMRLFGFYVASLNVVESDIEIKKIIEQHAELFDGKLGKFKYEKIDVRLQKEVTPKFCKPRPVPMALKKQLDQELDKMVEDGIITLQSANAWGTPLVPILKPDGTIRVCADYKITVNRYVEDIKYPFPRIEEIFASLSEGERFTKLDLSAAYNQLELTEESKRILAWSTHRGIYIVNRLPFGVKSACSIFQKTIEKVLLGAKGVTAFLDDIIVTGRNREEHLRNLKDVFQRLSKAGLRLKTEKCSFFQSEIRYLGHIISKDGLKKDPKKVEALVNAPNPTSIQEVQAFIGMVNYYSKFVRNFSDILFPLYELLKLKEFVWSRECEKAFQSIKNKMTDESFLTHFDPNLQIKIACDASNVGIGAVLLHIFPDGSEKPIAFASRVLRNSEKNYSVIHREALAIYWAVNKFFQYLVGNEFILCSDHKPLQALFGENQGLPQLAAGRLQRWALFLSGLKYKFLYVKGKDNGGADGLSRLPLQKKMTENADHDYFHFLVENRIPVSADQIRKETSRDSVLSKVFLYSKIGWPKEFMDELKPYVCRANEISIENGIVMWGYRAIIPKKLQSILLEELHSSHVGMAKMKMLARQYVWWPNLDKNIENYVKDCTVCRSMAKAPAKATLIKFREAESPFERIHIDFLGPFYGKVYLLIIDAHSKWPEIFEMAKVDSINTIDKLRECFARFGLPKMFFSDNGRQFTSAEFANFCERNGIIHRTSAPYHPASNGQAENAVGAFKTSINKMLSDKRDESVKMTTLISRYLMTYRNVPHCTTGESPAKRLLGYNVNTRLSFLNKTETEKAREKQIKHFHGNRNITFDEGEIVYARCFKNPAKPTWQRAIIVKRLGERNYLCKSECDNESAEWKRHTDQLIKSGQFYDREVTDLSVFSKNAVEGIDNYKNAVQERVLNNPSDDCFDKQQHSVSEIVINNSPEAHRPVCNAPDESVSDQCEVKDTMVKVYPHDDSVDNVENSRVSKTKTKSYIRDENLNVNQRTPRVIKPVKRLNL